MNIANNSLCREIVFVLTMCVIISGVALGQNATPFGPGVAGQVYSLAYDPDDPNTIYAGGDMHGVFKTIDGGGHWTVINEGLQNDDCNESFYIMALLVLGDFHNVPESRKGVYAGTAGGVFFREKGSSSWTLMTDYELSDDYWYEGGNDVGTQGNGIPFSSFAFCQDTGILYAGTGSTRLLNDACETYQIYPQHPGGGYSIWTLDVSDESSDWGFDTNSFDKKMVKQVAVIERTDGYPDDIVFASCDGIFKKNQSTGAWEEIFISGSKAMPTLVEPWSDYPTGVAGGSNNYLYCISKNSEGTIGGIYELVDGEYLSPLRLYS